MAERSAWCFLTSEPNLFGGPGGGIAEERRRRLVRANPLVAHATRDEFTAAWQRAVGPYAEMQRVIREVAPVLEELVRDFAGRLKVVKVNVDDNHGLARRFDATSIPTLVVLRDGQVVKGDGVTLVPVHTPGHAFAADSPWQHELEASFPYELTPDQRRVKVSWIDPQGPAAHIDGP